MNVTHHGQVYVATALDAVIQLTPKPPAPAQPEYICSLCGAKAPSAEALAHKPDCPEAKPIRKSA